MVLEIAECNCCKKPSACFDLNKCDYCDEICCGGCSSFYESQMGIYCDVCLDYLDYVSLGYSSKQLVIRAAERDGGKL